MASLATAPDLAARLNTTFDAGQTAQAEQFLEEASALIRATTGQTISFVAGDTFTTEAPNGLWLDLPQRPVRQIGSVLVGDQPVTDVTLVGDRLFRRASWDNRYVVGSWWPWFPAAFPYTVTIIYDHGYHSADEGIVLAKSACLAIASQTVVNPGGVASEAIDDYRVQFRDNAGTLTMSEALEKRLVQAYGRGAFTVRPAARL